MEMKRLTLSVLLVLFLTTLASSLFAADRNFILFLATVPKSGGSTTATELPNRKAIEDMWFSEGVVPDIYGGSWHEWLVENSYGVEKIVNAEVPAWIAMPWPIARETGFIDLNDSLLFEYGASAGFADTQIADNAFTPGERYKDLNGNGSWNGPEPWYDCYAYVDGNGRHYDMGKGGEETFLSNSNPQYPARKGEWDTHGEAFVDYNEDGQYSGIVTITVADKNNGVNRLIFLNELYIPRYKNYIIDLSDFPLDWTTTNGTTGSNNKIYFYDEDGNSIYTAGEDIWLDYCHPDADDYDATTGDETGLAGIYDATDILLFDGGNGWRIKNFPNLFSGINNGMYFAMGAADVEDGGDGDTDYEGGGIIGPNDDNADGYTEYYEDIWLDVDGIYDSDESMQMLVNMGSLRHGDVGLNNGFMYLDANGNGQYNSGETVWFEVSGDSSFTYDEDIMVAGSLKGTGTYQATDYVIREGSGLNAGDAGSQADIYYFEDSNDNGYWDEGEGIWQEVEGTFGQYNNDGGGGDADDVPILATNLEDGDSGIKIKNTNLWIDDDGGAGFDAATDSAWAYVISVDTQIYSGGNGIWETPLETVGVQDGDLLFVDLDSDGYWDTAETVFYDANGNGDFDLVGDAVLKGSAPSNGTDGTAGPLFRFNDDNSNGVYDLGEEVWNDGDGDTEYSGDGHAWNVFYDDTAVDGGRLNGTYDADTDDVWYEVDNAVFDSNKDYKLYDGEGFAYEGDRYQVQYQDRRIAGDDEWITADGTAGIQTGLYFYDENLDGVFNVGDAIFIDENSDGEYNGPDTQVFLGDPDFEDPLEWNTGNGAAGIQTKLLFYDANNNGVWDELWDSGIWVDVDGDGQYGSIDADGNVVVNDIMRVGQPPEMYSAGISGDLFYNDLNGNDYPDVAEEIWKDDSGQNAGIYDANGIDTVLYGTPVNGKDPVMYYISADQGGDDQLYYYDEDGSLDYTTGEDVWWDIDEDDDEGYYNEASVGLNKTFDPALDNAGLPIIEPLEVVKVGGGRSQAEVSWEYFSAFDDNGDPVATERRIAYAYESPEIWTDSDGDVEYDFEDPWEDYMARWDPFIVDDIWFGPLGPVPLMAPGYVRTDAAYIRNNYPGDVGALMQRSGNGQYDPSERAGFSGQTKVRITGWDPFPGVLWPGAVSGLHPDFFSDIEIWDRTKYSDGDWTDWWTRQFSSVDYTSSAPLWPSGGSWWNQVPIMATVADGEAEIRGFSPSRGHTKGSNEADYADYADAPIINAGRWSGPPEYYDLASALYHTTQPGHFTGHGDGWLGEETDPFSTVLHGADHTEDNNPGSPFTDDIVYSGGPLAYNLYGETGHDSANMTNLEIQTWRTDGASLLNATADVGSPLGFQSQYRDINLDGFIDLGECPIRGCMNYSVDLDPLTVDDGVQTIYPMHRTRLMEDCFEANDDALDYDRFAALGDGSHINTTALIDADSDFAPIAPATYSVFTVDSDNVFGYSDWVCGHGAGAEGSEEAVVSDDDWYQDYSRSITAHEFGHYWFGWPDLYDYDVWNGVIINWPIGLFDLMSAAVLVHSMPFLKMSQNWTESNDLATILIPGVPQEVHMDPVEYIKNQYYHFKNQNYPNEDYYFWYRSGLGFQVLDPTRGSPDDPKQGIMILHTDADANAEGVPQQQRKGNHFTWNIVQADALEQLEAGYNLGDDGDIFPGGSDYINDGGASKHQFGPNTDPMNRWWDQTPSGIEILDIDLPADPLAPAIVTFFMDPKTIPTLSFIHPPGGSTVNGVYKVKYNAYDVFGSVRMFFYMDTNDLGYDGTCLQTISAPLGATWDSTDERYEVGGVPILFNDSTVDRVWTADEDIWLDENGDGRYNTGENQLYTGIPNNDSDDRVWGTADGTIGFDSYYAYSTGVRKKPKDVEMDQYVNENSLNEGNNYFYARLVPQKSPDQPGGGSITNRFFNDANGNETRDATEDIWMDQDPFGVYNSADGDIQIDIGTDGWTTANGTQGLPVTVFDEHVSLDLRSHTKPRLMDGAAGVGSLYVTHVDYLSKYGEGSKLETWIVKMVDETTQEWEVRGTLSGLQSGRATTGKMYASDDNEMVFLIRNTDSSAPFEKGDKFAFMTTGLTAYSGNVMVEDGEILGVEVLIEIADLVPSGDRIDVNSSRYDLIAFNMRHANVTSQDLQVEKIRLMVQGIKVEPDANDDGVLDDVDANNDPLDMTAFLADLTGASTDSGLLFYFDNGNEDGRWDTADDRLNYIFTDWDLVENAADDIQRYGQDFVRKYGKKYYYDANANGRWDTGEEVWLDSSVAGTNGIYDADIDIQINAGTDVNGDGDDWDTAGGTPGKVYHEYYLTDVFFPNGVLVPIDDKQDNEGSDMFVCIKTSANMRFTDKIRFTIPNEGVYMSSGITGLSEFVTRELDGNVPIFFTDYLGGNSISKNTTFAAFGMNLGAKEDDGTSVYLDTLSVRIMDAGAGNVTSADFQELKADSTISGVALWKDADNGGAYDNGKFDWNDADGDGQFDIGETTWDDADGDGVFDPDEQPYDTPVMFMQTPVWSFGKVTMSLPNPSITYYYDSNSNGRWDINEEIWSDAAAGTTGTYDNGVDAKIYSGIDANGDGEVWETADGTAGKAYSIPIIPLSVDDNTSGTTADPDMGDDFFVTITTSNYTENKDVFTVGVKEDDVVFKHGNTVYKYGEIYNTTFINSLFTVSVSGEALTMEETATNKYLITPPVAPSTELVFSADSGISPYTWYIGDLDETDATGDSFTYTTPDSETVGEDGTKILLTVYDNIGVEIVVEIPVKSGGTSDPGGAGEEDGEGGEGGTGDEESVITLTAVDTSSNMSETFTSTPAMTSVDPGGSLILGASGGTAPYSWSVSTNASGASLSGTTGNQVTYIAGATEGGDTITITDSADNTFSLSVIVQTGGSGTIGGEFRVYPEEVTVGLSATILLYAMGGSGSYSWTIVTNASGCSIDASGGSSVTYSSGSEDRQIDVVEVMDNVTLETKQITIRVLSGASGTSTKTGGSSTGGGCFIGALRK